MSGYPLEFLADDCLTQNGVRYWQQYNLMRIMDRSLTKILRNESVNQ